MRNVTAGWGMPLVEGVTGIRIHDSLVCGCGQCDGFDGFVKKND
jgi:hypothetical protein